QLDAVRYACIDARRVVAHFMSPLQIEMRPQGVRSCRQCLPTTFALAISDIAPSGGQTRRNGAG
ncbi:hypothetical protein AB8A31_29040, partial [Tardiphaga sp. 804_B3_N1_9]|uniref:hypothetical protein n=1 Tax=Tardiphaga sp. 804_B3_N1_9 TaxID=3240786 RepID=UPI003F267B26